VAASTRIVDTNSSKNRGARGAPPRQLSDERPTDELGMALLATKLTPPHISLGQVSRSRLLDLLDSGAQRLLTLVSAPAGAGKTTLLAFWSSSHRTPGPVAWLSLDTGDNHPARFWAYVLAALCQSDAVPGDSPLRGLSSAQPGSDDTFLLQLVSGLAELPTPVVLVLDDLHDITDAAVLAGLEFLLRHAPPQLRLVLATRADPPLPLQRLLVSGQLAQVGRPTWRSPSPRRLSCWLRATTRHDCPRMTWRCCRHVQRDGPRGCGWRPFRLRVSRIRTGSWPSSPATTRASPTT
jgi:hypothetical protein